MYTIHQDDVTDGETYETIEDAREAAGDWARDGAYGDVEETIWVETYIHDEDGDVVETVTTAIDPEEPDCTESDHDWQSPYEILGGLKENPGVWGHGGGVIITTCCMHCGCKRVRDTWAQNPENGEQGLRSVRYEAGAFADEIAKFAEASS